MKRTSLLLAASGLMLAPALGHAQTWSTSQPTISASAVVPVVRQFNTTNSQSLNFGSITPGDSIVVSPTTTGATSSDPNAAKLEIRFNWGTKVTVTAPGTLTHTNGTTTLAVASYTCNVASDNTGTGATAFTCATGHEWLSTSVSGMTTRWVLIGGKIASSATSSALAGTYSGNVTVTLAASTS